MDFNRQKASTAPVTPEKIIEIGRSMTLHSLGQNKLSNRS